MHNLFASVHYAVQTKETQHCTTQTDTVGHDARPELTNSFSLVRRWCTVFVSVTIQVYKYIIYTAIAMVSEDVTMLLVSIAL